MVIFLKQKKFISQQSLKGPYIYDIHMKGGGGVGVKICHVFADSFVFK